jgi:hypothetical protein
MRTVLTIFFAACAANGADPEKPLTLAEDELAVLADVRSPDFKTVVEKYNGKLLKFTGNVGFRDGAQFGGPSGFDLRIPGKKPKERPLVLVLRWSASPTTKATQDKLIDGRKDVAMTIYGRATFTRDPKDEYFTFFGLTDVALDPKVAGKPYEPEEPPPPRLKPKDKK